MVVDQYVFLNPKLLNMSVKNLLLSTLLASHLVVFAEGGVQTMFFLDPIESNVNDTLRKAPPTNNMLTNKLSLVSFLPERKMQISKIDITKLEYKIFISHQLSQAVIKKILQEASDFDAKIYLRGLIPQLNLNQTIQYWQSYAGNYDPIPQILIDPTEFRENNVVSTPTIVAHYQGDKIATVTGIYSIQWLKKQIEIHVKDIITRTQSVETTAQLMTHLQQNTHRYATFLDFGIQGSSTGISETDLLDTLLARLHTFDFKKFKEQATERFWQSYPYIQLPKALTCQRHTLNPIVTLTQPLLDQAGHTILPIGFEYNPLNYLPFTQQLIIFNASHAEEKTQVKAWLQKQNQNTQHTLIANVLDQHPSISTLSELESEFNAPIYLLTPLIQSRFIVTSTPTIISAEQNKFVIESGCL